MIGTVEEEGAVAEGTITVVRLTPFRAFLIITS